MFLTLYIHISVVLCIAYVIILYTIWGIICFYSFLLYPFVFNLYGVILFVCCNYIVPHFIRFTLSILIYAVLCVILFLLKLYRTPFGLYVAMLEHRSHMVHL
jgi:hypothetical protein